MGIVDDRGDVRRTVDVIEPAIHRFNAAQYREHLHRVLSQEDSAGIYRQNVVCVECPDEPEPCIMPVDIKL